MCRKAQKGVLAKRRRTKRSIQAQLAPQVFTIVCGDSSGTPGEDKLSEGNAAGGSAAGNGLLHANLVKERGRTRRLFSPTLTKKGGSQ